MKLGVVLLCRYSSARLPGKIMLEIKGRPVIDYIVERILLVVNAGDLCVATSTDRTDDVIADYCKIKNINCFRGDLDNVGKRFLDTALHNGWEYAVRINGDNFFVETNVLRFLIAKAHTRQFDFLTNTHNKTFPQGMSVEIVRTAFYEEAYKSFQKPEDFEHVTMFLHKHKIGNYFFHDNTECIDAGKLKFAIDEEKDFLLCAELFEKMDGRHLSYNMEKIVELYRQIADQKEVNGLL